MKIIECEVENFKFISNFLYFVHFHTNEALVNKKWKYFILIFMSSTTQEVDTLFIYKDNANIAYCTLIFLSNFHY